jgi:hypothetical protein
MVIIDGDQAWPPRANHAERSAMHGRVCSRHDTGALDDGAVLGPLPERPVVHSDAGHEWRPCRPTVHDWRDRHARGAGVGAGQPPLTSGAHHARGNQDGKLRYTGRRRLVVESWLALVNAVIVLGRLIRRCWGCHR